MRAYQITKLPDTRLKVVKPIPCVCKGPKSGFFQAEAESLGQKALGDSVLTAMNRLVAVITAEYDSQRRGRDPRFPNQEHIEFQDHIEAQCWKGR